MAVCSPRGEAGDSQGHGPAFAGRQVAQINTDFIPTIKVISKMK